ncbi:MAG: dTDP-4-dehydrorhamnose 3,5-epimerase [Bacteroidia bacterium]|nr:dTDP-4-dehydrorhamnose 3,5-epimerase [Bacteroidia bacterium]
MKFTSTEIEGLMILEPTVFTDNRGTFIESFHAKSFKQNGIDAEFVQDNQSVSRLGVIRGLHFQESPHGQGKLVRVAFGRALDVVVDIRKGSATYGKSFSIELSSENNKLLWIPEGFAHGFEALSDQVIFSYKVTQYYNQSAERGILFNDPELGIKWHCKTPIVSEKDLGLPKFRQYAELSNKI